MIKQITITLIKIIINEIFLKSSFVFFKLHSQIENTKEKKEFQTKITYTSHCLFFL